MAKNRIMVVLAGDDKSLSQALSRVGNEAEKTGKSFKQKLATGAKVASVALLGGLAVAAKAGFSEMLEGQKVSAQTEAVLKSTGGAAKVTADQVSELAGALMRKSGIDDEAIQSGANLLLTFTRVRNEAGKGRDVFNQATTAALDMSVAMGTDMKSASIVVGKALNDPVKGLTALQRVGVTFTQGQRDAIKAMVAAGDTAGAQKIILGELRKEFGGSAEAAGKTMAGQVKIAQQTLLNLAGSIVSSLMPVLTTLAQWLGTVADWMSRNQTATKILVGVLAGLATGILAVNLATKAWALAQAALNVVLAANPIGLVVLAVAALALGLVVAWKKSETFRDIVTGAFDAVSDAASTVRGWIQRIVEKVQEVISWGGWDTIKRIAMAPFAAIKLEVQAVSTVVGAIITAAQAVIGWGGWGTIGRIVSAPFSAIEGAVGRVIGAIDRIISVARSAIGLLDSLFSRSDNTAQQRALGAIVRQGQRSGLPRGTRLPGRAHGGIVTSPEISLIGEAGPEAIIPLSRPRRARAVMAQAGLGGGGNSYTINVASLDPRAAATAVVEAIRDFERRNGRVFAPA